MHPLHATVKVTGASYHWRFCDCTFFVLYDLIVRLSISFFLAFIDGLGYSDSQQALPAPSRPLHPVTEEKQPKGGRNAQEEPEAQEGGLGSL